MVDPHLALSEVCRLHPEKLPVLAQFGMDLCCGGRLSLQEVAKKHGVDLAQLMRELEEPLELRS